MRECPQLFDICSIELNLDEKEQLMYQLMAELDLTREVAEPVKQAQGEDFVNHNK